MSCSNCKQLDEPAVIMCEKGHYLCLNCYTLSLKRCVQCGGRLIDFDKNMLCGAFNDVVSDWLTLNENQIQHSDDSLDGAPLDTDIESMNLIFSRSKSLDPDSSNSRRLDSYCSASKKVEASKSPKFEMDQSDFSANLETKDTRQNLLELRRDELRKQITDELFKAYKCDLRSLVKPEEFMCRKSSKTIGVSTDSTPNLNVVERPDLGSCEQVVEVVDLSQNANPVTNQATQVNQESSGISEDSHFLEVLRRKFSKMDPSKVDKIVTSIITLVDAETNERDKDKDKGIFKVESSNESQQRDFGLVTNSSRASYCPSASHPQIPAIPKPQFQPIAKKGKHVTQIVDASSLNISRSPIICPISSCQQASFVSNFTRHIAVDHSQVPLERMIPRHFKNFFLDPKLIHLGANRCQLLLLVSDKVKNLGHDEFKDFIPVLVMSTKISALDICSTRKPEEIQIDNEEAGSFLMIWLTGILAKEEPIFFSLTVWSRSGNVPTCHIVHSGQLYSVRNSQNSKVIHDSGQMLLLSQTQVDLLTNKGRNMLELQIEIN